MQTLSPSAKALNDVIGAASSPLGQCLSRLGQSLAFPLGIPVHAAEAKGKDYNATIGQITDGKGSALPLATMTHLLENVDEDLTSKAVLYSPIQGIQELRERWRAWQRRGISDDKVSSMPLVTVGLTHALSIVADIFAGPGRKVIVPKPFWGNYSHVFGVRTGAEMITPEGFVDGVYNVLAIEQAAQELPKGEAVLVVLNLPSNPGGYSLTVEERAQLRDSILRTAANRPVTVICDDAYAGLVYDESIPRHSMYWDLVGSHPNVACIKVDGVTKELSFFGGRVGFLTFSQEPDSAGAQAIESKVKHLVRATVGSPVAASQVMVLQKLRSPDLEAQVEGVRAILEERAHAVNGALAKVDKSLLRPMPCNSGCFALIQLGEGLPSSEVVRRHLLKEHSTGLVAIAPNYLRIAFCSVSAEALPSLVRHLEEGARELKG